ncbi:MULTISPECIES: arginase family protein [unclassified Cryobacterium]|uniref:arginase family protein n=1 Tax=unclassified Cryobacterium TaxID=2649013 RepID=UPI00106CD655|nr:MULTISPECIES: arginase family protein [unclassified Cryobacterium]TFB92293.1 arginase family protein [Cryobacterium sp. MDB2-A-1]TFC10971.1 arginase family protein [Cryobacterium sp. MDB2-33-2]TFC16090.1 arginase family protein [Cryobacterium sp. MDB2-A-2]TFC19018.1 arginase family protein [Cryobacterium sp. MDB2-10]TFC32101.1 arginase family protein [Cryobacterium sp. MDB1-18-2]
MIDLIVSQGRVADRASGMIGGAALTAKAFEEQYGLKGRYIGEPSLPAKDDWSISLPQAQATLLALGEALRSSIRDGNFPVISANTCSASLASLPVVAQEHPDAVVLYIDGHGDFNTPETTDTGYLGGMVLSGACGFWDSGHGSGLQSENAILVGSRDIDAAEKEALNLAGVRVIPPEHATAAEVVKAVNGARVWVHIDWDVLEPGHVPADYTVPGGLLPTQLREILQAIQPEQFIGIEMAEFNVTGVDATDNLAVETILDIVNPVLRGVFALSEGNKTL